MARRVFFSFHFQRDIFRVNVVRNHALTKGFEDAGYSDASLWEEARTKGEAAVKALIDKKFVGTSVTAVLIGAETSSRPFVKYEIEKSIRDRKGLFGIYINNIPVPPSGQVDPKGSNPFDAVMVQQGSVLVPASQFFPTYQWAADDGYHNFKSWAETAATQAGR